MTRGVASDTNVISDTCLASDMWMAPDLIDVTSDTRVCSI